MEKTLIENLEAAKKSDALEWNAALDEAIAIVKQQPSYPIDQAHIASRLPAHIRNGPISASDLVTDVYYVLAGMYLITPR